MAKKTTMPPVPVSMPREVRAGDPENRKGKLRIVGGSLSDNWNLILANQVTGALWLGNSDSDMIDRQLEATVAALEGIAPRNEMEAMAAAQMIGKRLAEKARAAGVEKVAFDRAGFAYHGRVKALADAAREAGLQF